MSLVENKLSLRFFGDIQGYVSSGQLQSYGPGFSAMG